MILIANWKAYVEDRKRVRELVILAKRLARATRTAVVLAPPAVFLGTLATHNTSAVQFAAQDVSVTTGGAATGELTAQAFAAAGATYAIIGHSERRAAGDTDTLVAKKMAHALAHGLIPILCVGERERDSDGHYLAGLRSQIALALESLTLKERTKVIVAYEPLWAIGKTADHAIKEDDLREMALYLRKVLAELLPGQSASRSTIIYGGSVEPENIRSLAAGSGIDGFLIGHASANPEQFREIVRALS